MNSPGQAGWPIKGRWIGEYRYDRKPGVYASGRPSGFTMELEKTGLGFFKGKVQDDLTTGMPKLGKIRGWRASSKIYFVKRMPVWTVRRVEPETAELGERIRDPQRRHPVILDSGRWYTESKELRGEWRILRSGTSGRGLRDGSARRRK
jgi:hypothetical protein